MKRSGPLKRKTPMKRGDGFAPYPLEHGTGPFKTLKRTRLNPISVKQRERKAARSEQASAEAARFKAAVTGCLCVFCGRTEAQAIAETGCGHEAHHIVSKQRLKKIGREDLLWNPRLAVAACEEPCHRQATSMKQPLTQAMLGDLWWFVLSLWAEANGIGPVLERAVPV